MRNEEQSVTADNLPSFRSPPLVETVIGVQFAPIRGLTNAHLGAFWRLLSDEWPKTRDVAPIPPQFERFGEELTWGGKNLQLQFSQDPSSRLQMRTESGDRMIQIQNGRFHYNWLRGASRTPYPRYKNAVLPGFREAWQRFHEFLTGEFSLTPDPNQWEITYVNHIPRGTVWETPADWPLLIPALLGEGTVLRQVQFESCSGEWHFEIPPHRGRLHVSLWHEKAISEDSDRLRLALTARGPLGQDSSIEEGLDLGHEIIVRSFVGLTSEQAQEHWR